MTDQDIPYIDDEIGKMPSDLRADLAEMGRNSLYFFAKGVLGFQDMTEGCHGPACKFLGSNPKQFKLLLWPRDHFKSSVVTIGGTLQMVVQNPENRNLIRNEVATNAQRFLRTIRQHAEGNRRFRALYSDVIPKDTKRVRWNDSELDFARAGQYPEPTVSAAGITSTSTSQHFNHITDDDPISEEAIKSELVMQEAINRIKGVDALMVHPEKDTHWLVGTRWSFADVYSWYERTFKGRMARYIRGAIEQGEPIFPERFSLAKLAEIMDAVGPYRWSCNYMNQPRNTELQDLNIEDLKFWGWNEAGDRVQCFDKAGQLVDSWRLDDLDVTITVDPAPAETVTSDRNAISVVGVSPRNQLIVLEAWSARCTSLELCKQWLDFVWKYSPRLTGIEKAVYQMSLKWFMKDAAEKRGLYVRIEPLKPGGKGKPHVRGLQPIMATGKLFIHPTQVILRQEMADYPLGEHDDVVDCLALQLQLMKGQLSPEYQEKLKHEEKKILGEIGGLGATQEELRKMLDLDPDESLDPDLAMAMLQGMNPNHLVHNWTS
jgi:hypothetical protein